jgi:hypoxanthine phosphoribosyltransferase
MIISPEKITVLISEKQIQDAVFQMAEKISQDYRDVDNLVIVGVLKGAFLFTADFVRHLKVPCQIEFIRLSSYEGATESFGKVKAFDLSIPDLTNKHVLVVEDIIDSGRTAKFLQDFFRNQGEVKSFKILSLLDKPSRRLPEYLDLKPDYCCFSIEDRFVIGYGLDFQQRYRELPYIAAIED